MSTLLHPFAAAGLFSAIEVQANASLTAGCLALSFCLRGDLTALVLSEPETPDTVANRRSLPPVSRHLSPESTRRDHLWQSTCCECFVARDNAPEYFEINLSPSRHWNVYHFTGYRQGISAPPLPPPVIRSQRGNGWYRLDAIAAGLPMAGDKASWRLGLSAVLAGRDGGMAYFALTHPSDKPDFHHPDSFIFSLK